jgi:hypothetical protein
MMMSFRFSFETQGWEDASGLHDNSTFQYSFEVSTNTSTGIHGVLLAVLAA